MDFFPPSAWRETAGVWHLTFNFAINYIYPNLSPAPCKGLGVWPDRTKKVAFTWANQNNGVAVRWCSTVAGSLWIIIHPRFCSPPADGGLGAADKPQAEPASSGGSLGGLSPAVRLLLETYQLDSRLIPATGPRGRLLKGDVLRFIAQEGRPFTKPEQAPHHAVPPPVGSVKTQKDPGRSSAVICFSVYAEHPEAITQVDFLGLNSAI